MCTSNNCHYLFHLDVMVLGSVSCILFLVFIFSVLFCSSVLNLAELVALRPDLQRLKKIIYFHENQLAYPVQKQQNRDFQYGYNQILSWYVFLNNFNFSNYTWNIHLYVYLFFVTNIHYLLLNADKYTDCIDQTIQSLVAKLTHRLYATFASKICLRCTGCVELTM